MSTLRNPRHERFAQLLFQGKSLTDAYTEAGYKGDRKKASRLGTKGDIRARVAELQAGTAKRVEISKAWVLEQLMKNYDRAMEAEPVVDENGQFTGTYRYQGGWANRALELIGKEIGMFVERKDIRMTRLQDMTRDELRVALAHLEDDTDKRIH